MINIYINYINLFIYYYKYDASYINYTFTITNKESNFLLYFTKVIIISFIKFNIIKLFLNFNP